MSIRRVPPAIIGGMSALVLSGCPFGHDLDYERGVPAGGAGGIGGTVPTGGGTAGVAGIGAAGGASGGGGTGGAAGVGASGGASGTGAAGGTGGGSGSGGTGGAGGTAGAGGCTVYFSEDFSDNSKGWTLQGEWAIGPTSAGTGQQQGLPDPASDHSTTSDNGVAGIVLGGNYASPVNGPNYLTSPVINLNSAGGAVMLTFWRWLNCDWDPLVTDTVEVYDSSSWVVVWSSVSMGKALITGSSWTRYEYDVTAHKNANFRVRFSHKTGKSGNFLAWIMSGWNIDDLSLSSGTCN